MADLPKTERVVGYVRVSTAAQVETDSLPAQRERIAAWGTYMGVPVDVARDVLGDEGISGAMVDNRPSFRRAVRRALENPGGTAFVVYKLDRLGRTSLDIQEVLALLLDAGVRIVSIGDGIDSASSMGSTILKLLTSILATFAELEKDTIVGRLQGARQRAKAGGRVYSREAAYGKRNAPRTGDRAMDKGRPLEEDADEQKTIDRIRELRAAGISYRRIADALIDEGMRPRRAARWSPATIQRIATGRRAKPSKKRSARIERARKAFLEEEDSDGSRSR